MILFRSLPYRFSYFLCMGAVYLFLFLTSQMISVKVKTAFILLQLQRILWKQEVKSCCSIQPPAFGHNLLNFIFSMTHYEQYSYAVKMDMLSENPCRKVTIPKGEAKEKDIYSLEELEQLLELLETAPLKYKLFFTMILYTGFRRSEMLGLEWKDIDWDNRIISVRRTSNYTAERGIYTDTTKTKKSQRSRRYPQLIFDLLKAYKAEQDEERLKLGLKWFDYDRIFVKFDGRPMNNGTPYLWLKELCDKNNLRFCDLHSFRHHNNMKTYLLNLKHINTYLPVKQKLSNDVILHLTVFILIMEYIIYIVY